MKAIIIENQYDIDIETKAFLEDNPNLFEEVFEMVGAQYRGTEEVLDLISKNDAIIVSSTFMDKDQLEDITEALTKMKGKKIFIHRFDISLGEYLEEDFSMKYLFHDFEKFLANLKKCFESHEVYSFDEEFDKEIEDKRFESTRFRSKRGKFNFKKVEL